MKAIVSSPGGAALSDVAMPDVGPGRVLVAVQAASLNRADLSMLTGGLHGPVGGLGQILGLEWAGLIVEVGKGVEGWRVGDRVMASGGGAFAEYVTGDPTRMLRIPRSLPFERASTLPVALHTMHDAISTAGRLRAGQSVLIQGASSGVGLMGLQIAKLMGAKLVIGSSSSADRRARLTEFGADLAVDTTDPDWTTSVLNATHGDGVDLVVDQVSGALATDTLRATRIGGRIVNVGRLGGLRAEFDFDLHALRQITYVGVTFRTRSDAQVAEIVGRAAKALRGALSRGQLRLPVDRVFPLAQAPAAFERMRANQHFGKLVLEIGRRD